MQIRFWSLLKNYSSRENPYFFVFIPEWKLWWNKVRTYDYFCSFWGLLICFAITSWNFTVVIHAVSNCKLREESQRTAPICWSSEEWKQEAWGWIYISEFFSTWQLHILKPLFSLWMIGKSKICGRRTYTGKDQIEVCSLGFFYYMENASYHSCLKLSCWFQTSWKPASESCGIYTEDWESS